MTDLLPIVSQFGAAGLIGVLWLMERRSAATRDRQLTDAHQALLERDRSVEALLDVVRENTRVIAALEHTQRELLATARDIAAGGLHRAARASATPAAARATGATRQAG